MSVMKQNKTNHLPIRLHSQSQTVLKTKPKSNYRLRVVPLSLSPSFVTRKKSASRNHCRANSWARASHPRVSRGHFFLEIYFVLARRRRKDYSLSNHSIISFLNIKDSVCYFLRKPFRSKKKKKSVFILTGGS